jgi:aminobenzoyl-glutamate utilization protein B
MVVAARTLAVAGVELFENPAEVAAARAAFNKRLDGRKWATRIPATGKPPMDYATK